MATLESSCEEQSCAPGANGCSRVGYCNAQGAWICRCVAGVSEAPCTNACGRTGFRPCTAQCGLTGICKVAETETWCDNCDDDADGQIDEGLTRSCDPNNCTTDGSQTCAAGVWGACTGCGGTTSCSACGTGGGTRNCTSSCGVEACQIPPRACQPANGCSVVGTQTCNAATNTWNACTGCGGTAPCQTAECGEASAAPCSTSCQPGACTPLATEVCNGCDDSPVGSPGRGLVDENLYCPGCEL